MSNNDYSMFVNNEGIYQLKLSQEQELKDSTELDSIAQFVINRTHKTLKHFYEIDPSAAIANIERV